MHSLPWSWSEQTDRHTEKTYTQCMHLCNHTSVHKYAYVHTHTYPCKHTHIHAYLPGGTMSSLKPLGEEGRKLDVIYHSFPKRQCPLCPKLRWGGVGGMGSREPVSGRSPSGPYFTDTPDGACCQERCLISSPDCCPRSPQQREALCPRPHPWHLLRRDPSRTHRGDLEDEGATSCTAAPRRATHSQA